MIVARWLKNILVNVLVESFNDRKWNMDAKEPNDSF
jgi:hypothetical protein